MILSVHAIAGATAGKLFSFHPIAAFFAAVASHFLLDSIPHKEYPLVSVIKMGHGSSYRKNLSFSSVVRDGLFILTDIVAGIAVLVALSVFSRTPALPPAIIVGAIGGVFPDLLQLITAFYPVKPLRGCQKFHDRAHFKKHGDKVKGGIIFQIIIFLFSAAILYF